MINVALIGCGNWGRNYLRNLSELPSAKLVGCCDKRDGVLRQIKEHHPLIKVTNDFNEIASNPKIDAVVVATPPATHYQIARTCLLRGKHVLVEKPFTLSPVDAEELVALSQKTGKVLMVGHILAYHPGIQLIKEYIQSGELGPVCYIRSIRTSLGLIRNDVSVLWDKAPHDVAILLYLLGEEPTHVSAGGQAFMNPRLEDMAFLSLRFQNNIIANIHVSWAEPRKASTTVIVGRNRMAVFDDVDSQEKVKIYNNGVENPNFASPVPIPVVRDSGDSLQDNKERVKNLVGGVEGGRDRMPAVTIPKIQASEPLRNQCLHFIECIEEGKEPLTDGKNGLAVVRVLDRAEDSMRSNSEYLPLNGGYYDIASNQRTNIVAKARSIWRGLRFERIF